MIHRRRSWLAGLAASVIVLAGLATGQAASAAVLPKASFNAVSCPSRNWCMAVGKYTAAGVAHALAEEWSAGTWHPMKPPAGELISVSCISPFFCMAGRNTHSADIWNGRSWRRAAGTSLYLKPLSCASRKLCMTTQGSEVWTWSGRSWRAQPSSNICDEGPPGGCGLNDVSCGSITDCVAVGYFSESQEEDITASGAFFWNGRTWSFSLPPSLSDNSNMNSVSCRFSVCMSVGTAYGNTSVTMAAIWNARKPNWRDVSPKPGDEFFLDQVSCGTTTRCMAIDDSGNSLWNGHKWLTRNSLSAGRGSLMAEVSCGGPVCMGVGYRTIKHVMQPLAELWNGSRWRILSVPARGL